MLHASMPTCHTCLSSGSFGSFARSNASSVLLKLASQQFARMKRELSILAVQFKGTTNLHSKGNIHEWSSSRHSNIVNNIGPPLGHASDLVNSDLRAFRNHTAHHEVIGGDACAIFRCGSRGEATYVYSDGWYPLYPYIYIYYMIFLLSGILYIHIIIPMYHYVCWFIMASCMITISSPLYQHLSSVQCYTGWLRTGFHFMDNDDP